MNPKVNTARMKDNNSIFSPKPILIEYDGSWAGLLTAVFCSFERKWNVSGFLTTNRPTQADMFAEKMPVTTDPVKAERVWAGLKKKIPAENCLQLYRSYLSELPGIELSILSCIRFYFSKVPSPHQAYGNSDVLKINQTAKMVYREKHRMEAFVRFQRTGDDLYYAGIEPDFNVIPLLSAHFKNRYADQRWLIYDLRRKYGIYYDLKTVEEITLNFSDDAHGDVKNIFHDSEILYQELWQDYFKHVNIAARRNIKLHVQHVPKRYWKHLTEKS
jgi:probable DNA metabolism protein